MNAAAFKLPLLESKNIFWFIKSIYNIFLHSCEKHYKTYREMKRKLTKSNPNVKKYKEVIFTFQDLSIVQNERKITLKIHSQ